MRVFVHWFFLISFGFIVLPQNLSLAQKVCVLSDLLSNKHF